MGVVEIELSGLNGAVRAAETASGAALVHHGAQAIGRVIGGPRRAYAFTRGIPAMGTHKGGAAAHVDPVHKTPAGSIFVRDERHVIFEIAGQDALAATIAGIQIDRHAETVESRGSRNLEGTRNRDFHEVKRFFRLRHGEADFVFKALEFGHRELRRDIAEDRRLTATEKEPHDSHQRATLDEFATIHSHKIPYRASDGKRRSTWPQV